MEEVMKTKTEKKIEPFIDSTLHDRMMLHDVSKHVHNLKKKKDTIKFHNHDPLNKINYQISSHINLEQDDLIFSKVVVDNKIDKDGFKKFCNENRLPIHQLYIKNTDEYDYAVASIMKIQINNWDSKYYADEIERRSEKNNKMNQLEKCFVLRNVELAINRNNEAISARINIGENLTMRISTIDAFQIDTYDQKSIIEAVSIKSFIYKREGTLICPYINQKVTTNNHLKGMWANIEEPNHKKQQNIQIVDSISQRQIVIDQSCIVNKGDNNELIQSYYSNVVHALEEQYCLNIDNRNGFVIDIRYGQVSVCIAYISNTNGLQKIMNRWYCQRFFFTKKFLDNSTNDYTQIY